MNHSAMKKILLLLVALLSLSLFANAQSLDKALEQLETVRVQKGEQSQEYLSALDSVIKVAYLTNNHEVRYNYRKKYVEILEEIKGKNNGEYVKSLWRLGYAGIALGDTTNALYHFYDCFEILDGLLADDDNPSIACFYNSCLFDLFKFYCASNNYVGAQSLLEKLVAMTEKCTGKYSCYHFEMMQNGAMVAYRLNSPDDYERFSIMTIKNDEEIDSCNYIYICQAYNNLINDYFFQKKDIDRSKELAIDYLRKLKGIKEGLLHEKAMAYFWNSAIWFGENDDYSMECGRAAEQLLKEYYNTQQELLRDPIYYSIASQLAQQAEAVGNYKDEAVYCDVCCKIMIEDGMRESRDYYFYLDRLFTAAVLSNENRLALSVSEELQVLIPLYAVNINRKTCEFNKGMCDVYAQLFQYDEAIKCCDKVLEIEGRIFQDTVACANSLYRKAELYRLLRNKEKALESVRKGRFLINNCSGSLRAMSAEADLLRVESDILKDDEEYELSVAKIDTALFIDRKVMEMEKQDGTVTESSNIAYALDLKVKGGLLRALGYSHEALGCFREASTKFDKYHTKHDPTYIDFLLKLAVCQIECYDYTEGHNTLNTVKPLILDVFGEKSTQYAEFLETYAIYYFRISDYGKAMKHFLDASNVYKDLFGEYSLEYASDLALTSYLLELTDYHEEASVASFQTLMILDSLKIEHNRTEMYAKTVLAHAWNGMGIYDSADSLYMENLFITEKLYGKRSKQVAGVMSSWGNDLYFLRSNPAAFQYFTEAIAIYDSLDIIQTNPEYTSLLARYVKSGLDFDKELKISYLQLFSNNLKNIVRLYVSFYSLDDREKVYNRVSLIKNVFFNIPSNYQMEKSFFEVEMYFKSFLLNTSRQFQRAVFNSGRQDLIDQYNDIQALQRALDYQSFSLLNNQTPELLNNRKTLMERNLIGHMKSMGYLVIDSLSYEDVTRSLKPNEIAIEFVDYYHIKDKKTYYVALLAKSNWDKPVYVQLCTEDALKACIGNPNVTYSTDDLYRLLWQPLLEYVGDSCTVYFSPSGMLHTIALESIHTPDGSCLSDKYNLVRITSTRELCKEKRTKTYETGAIYGGLQYDVEQQRMAKVAEMTKVKVEESPVFAQKVRGEDRGNWRYLPGTLDEVEHIVGIMRKANIECKPYEGDLGSEESFKALSGGNTDIIHLATHGYFLEGEKADMNDFMKSLSPLARQKTDSVIDPLLRSGLILSGGNSAWLGKEVPQGIEDGVLTALEISTMNLSGTDMVVMSACETGLGDITSDGVFGLQRAFKMAGVQTLVMSLWKVDDNATSLMMQTFYEQLLSGKTKREAFNLAQAAVRAKYPEPYYWAGFVMLD